MSPCDIPLRVRIFLIFSPSFLLINISTVYEILHFPTILHYNSIWKRRSKTKNFLSIFCRLPPHPPPRERRKGRKNFGFFSRDRRERTRRADWSVRFNSESPRAPCVRLVAFVRVHLEMQSNFVQYTPPKFGIRRNGQSGVAPKARH